MSLLQTLEIETGANPGASIIWLHGLGADGHDFAPITNQMSLPFNVRFIFPHAPQRPVTINGGYIMRAWYDVYAPDLEAMQDEKGIRSSALLTEELIAIEKKRGIAANQIMLAGFSQGGAIALHTGLRHEETLGGIIALSTYLPLHQMVAKERSQAGMQTPIFMAHGTFDNVIPLQAGQASAGFLRSLGYPVELHEYPMPHSVCSDEIMDIRNFITTRFTTS